MPKLDATILVTLSVISIQGDDNESRSCPACKKAMQLHQPDSGFPERMLWTCEHCGTWFLMDLIPDSHEAVMVCLPDEGFFRAAMGR